MRLAHWHRASWHVTHTFQRPNIFCQIITISSNVCSRMISILKRWVDKALFHYLRVCFNLPETSHFTIRRSINPRDIVAIAEEANILNSLVERLLYYLFHMSSSLKIFLQTPAIFLALLIICASTVRAHCRHFYQRLSAAVVMRSPCSRTIPPHAPLV